jgi:hypothetical protein
MENIMIEVEYPRGMRNMKHFKHAVCVTRSILTILYSKHNVYQPNVTYKIKYINITVLITWSILTTIYACNEVY